MRVIGITGNIGAGKSTVAEVWREAGVPVADADSFAREVVAPGTPGLREIVAAFGREVLDASGALDRKELGRRVFADPGLRDRLERITHPAIERARHQWLAEREAEGHRVAAVEIPLLFEAGLEQSVDRIVLVTAPVEARLRRLVEDRGLSPEEARERMRAQIDPEWKRSRSDAVIENEGSREELRGRALEVLREVAGEANPAG